VRSAAAYFICDENVHAVASSTSSSSSSSSSLLLLFNKNRQTAVTNIRNRNVNQKTETIKCHDIIHDDVINMYTLRDWLKDISLKCVLIITVRHTYSGKLCCPKLNIIHGHIAQKLAPFRCQLCCSIFRLHL